MGNEQSVSYRDNDSSPYSSVTESFKKPIRPATRKSSSIRYESHESSGRDRRNTAGTTSSYIPNMNIRTAGNGLIIPTTPYDRHSSVDKQMLGSHESDMSPQWGWYINTTPPTPELYHSSTSKSQSMKYSAASQKHQVINDDNTNNAKQFPSTFTISNADDVKSCQNRVFQSLQNSTTTNRMGGWTSIPI